MNRLVDYEAYRAHYIVHGSFRSPMGSFKESLLTAAGAAVLNQAVSMVGRKPTFRGVSKAGIYLKWQLKHDGDNDAILILRDWLLDAGFDVTGERMNNTRRDVNRGDHPSIRCYIKLTIA